MQHANGQQGRYRNSSWVRGPWRLLKSPIGPEAPHGPPYTRGVTEGSHPGGRREEGHLGEGGQAREPGQRHAHQTAAQTPARARTLPRQPRTDGRIRTDRRREGEKERRREGGKGTSFKLLFLSHFETQRKRERTSPLRDPPSLSRRRYFTVAIPYVATSPQQPHCCYALGLYFLVAMPWVTTSPQLRHWLLRHRRYVTSLRLRHRHYVTVATSPWLRPGLLCHHSYALGCYVTITTSLQLCLGKHRNQPTLTPPPPRVTPTSLSVKLRVVTATYGCLNSRYKV